MYQHLGKVRSLPGILAAAAVMATSLAVAVPSAALAAAGTCTVNEQGSTTVYPALTQAQGGFQSSAHCTLTTVPNGSGPGLTALLNYHGIGGSSSTEVNIAASSRALNSGNEANNLYAFKVGGDATVIAVRNSPAMSFLNNINANQLQAIYNNSDTTWNQVNPAWPNRTIYPRSRIEGSGSRDDFLGFISLSKTDGDDAVVARTGLSRLTSSNDEATAACNNDDQIVYTSLANLLAYGPSGQNCLKALGLAAASSTGYVMPSTDTVKDGTYPAPRQLFVVIPKFSVLGSTETTDDSDNVKAFDLVNYMLSADGQTAIGAVGFLQEAVPAVQPIPDYDVNLDGTVGLSDIGKVIAKWTTPSNPSCPGWIRADVNNDGTIGLSDIGKIIKYWTAPGFVPPAS